jgi:nucleoside-diphosphate-sugar epimerase
VFGPNDRITCARVLQSSEQGIPLVAGKGRWRFGYCHVGNLCQAAELALVKPGIEGRAYTVTNRVLPTWNDFFRAMQEGLGKRQKVYVPVFITRVLAVTSGAIGAVFPGFKDRITPYRIHRVTTETTYDISRTISELGYAPDDDYKKQFAEIIDWYKKEKADGRLA